MKNVRTKPSESADLDIAIVGGGIAGTYAAYRLLSEHWTDSPLLTTLVQGRSNPSLQVGLFELDQRIGGRLYSHVPDDMPHIRAELGGMRYYSTQLMVKNLVQHLGLATREFIQGEANNLFYLRGKRFRLNDFADPKMIPYFLDKSEQGRIPASILLDTLDHVAPGARQLSPQDFHILKPTLSYQGELLCDWGFWNLMLTMHSVECINLIRDAGGYDGLVSSINTADLLGLAVEHLAHPPHFETLVEGFQVLPKTLVQKFQDQGGQVNLGHRLLNLVQLPDGRLRLHLHDCNDDETKTVTAHHVVLAMPQRSLELLDRQCFLFQNAQLVDDLQSVIPSKACKTFLCYPHPWWRDLGIKSGRSDTDLPMRQCYYFGTEGEQAGADPDNQNSLLMAGYNDGRSVEFWSGYLGKSFSNWEWGGTGQESLPTEVPSSLISSFQAQLQEIHGPKVQIPQPYAAYFLDWEQDPYGGAWHSWRVHARSWEVMPRIRHPVADVNVYICGEAYSAEQGWVQGALHTTEHVLQDHLGLSPASFLPKEYYLGP